MSLSSSMYEQGYARLCRAYARTVLRDRPADGMFRFLCALHFWKLHRYWPRFLHPRSYSEKIWHRMLHDRDPRWTIISDKLRSRAFVAERVGRDRLVPILWQGTHPDGIPYEALPAAFVIKASHGWACNVLVQDQAALDRAATRRTLERWLAKNFCLDAGLGVEWGYKHIEPRLFVEDFLNDGGKPPRDYKLRCFAGRVEFMTVHFDRVGLRSSSLVCNRQGRPIDCRLGHPYEGGYAPPENIDAMIEVAETVARGFDFLRVDLYNLAGKIYVGELTAYPAAGSLRFYPRSYDFFFGEKWAVGTPVPA